VSTSIELANVLRTLVSAGLTAAGRHRALKFSALRIPLLGRERVASFRVAFGRYLLENAAEGIVSNRNFRT